MSAGARNKHGRRRTFTERPPFSRAAFRGLSRKALPPHAHSQLRAGQGRAGTASGLLCPCCLSLDFRLLYLRLVSRPPLQSLLKQLPYEAPLSPPTQSITSLGPHHHIQDLVLSSV